MTSPEVTHEQVTQFLRQKPGDTFDVSFLHRIVTSRSIGVANLSLQLFCVAIGAALSAAKKAATAADLAALFFGLSLVLELKVRQKPAAKLAPSLLFCAVFENNASLLNDNDLVKALEKCHSLLDRNKNLRETLQENAKVASAACRALVEQRISNIQLLNLVANILKTTSDQLKNTTNQKKAFQLFLDTLLAPLLELRHFLRSTDHVCVDLANNMIESSLFHKDHMRDFVTVLETIVASKSNTASLEDSCATVLKNLTAGKQLKEKTSYPKLLFDRLLEILKDGPKEYLVCAFPYLLSAFIDSRKRNVKSQDSNLAFSADFACFTTLFSILIHVSAPSSLHPAAAPKGFIDSVSKLMTLDSEWSTSSGGAGVVGRLIHVLVLQDVYKATQDRVSQSQLRLFKDLNSAFVRVLRDLEGRLHGGVFDAMASLMQIEHSIVMESMEELWGFLVLPKPESRASALSFTILLMQTLTKSRELETFLTQCLNALSELSQNELSDSILLDDAFLKAFAICVSKTLPAQLPPLLTMLVHQFLEPEQDAPPHKRAASAVTTSPSTTLHVPTSIDILTNLLALLIQYGTPKVAAAPALQKAFGEVVDTLFDRVVVPLVSPTAVKQGLKRSHDDEDDLQRGVFVKHGLVLLYALMQSSEEFWKRRVSTEFVVSIQQHQDADAQIRLLKMRVALFHAECVAGNSVDPRREALACELVEGALAGVEGVLVKCGEGGGGVWDGSLERVGEENLGVAVWACLLDHLVPICHLATPKQIENITETLIETIKSDERVASRVLNEGQYDLRLLSASLFQSSQFYELRAIRDIFLPKLIANLVSELETNLSNHDTTSRSIMTLLSTPLHPSLAVSVTQTLTSLPTAPPSTLTLPTQTFTRVRELVSILNTFPTVCFLHQERDAVVCVLVLVECLVARAEIAGQQEKEGGKMRFAAVCRKLEARFMESRDDTLVTLYSPKVLEWFLDSLSTYELAASSSSGDASTKPPFLAVLQRETGFIQELTLTKLMQRFSGSLPKGSITTPLVYLTATVSNLQHHHSKAESATWLDRCLPFLRALAHSLPASTKKQTDSAQEDAMEVEDGKHVQMGKVMDLAQGLVKEAEAVVVRVLEGVQAGGGVVGEWGVCGSAGRVLEQVVLLKEGYGVLEGSKTLEQLYEFSNAFLGTLSEWVHKEGAAASPHVIELGAMFLSIRLHQLEGQAEGVEEAGLANLVNLCWALETAAWRKNPTAISAIHAALSVYAFKSAASTGPILGLLNSSLELVESLVPLALGLDNVLSETADLPAALDLLVVIIGGVQKSVKRASIRKILQRVIVVLARIVEGSASIDLTVQSVVLLTRLADDKVLILSSQLTSFHYGANLNSQMLEMKSSDIALVLNACCLLSSPTSPLYLSTLQPTTPPTFLTPDDLFDALCRLLTTLLTHRREPLVDAIPSFVGVLRGLLHCFKQDLGGLRGDSNSSGTHVETFVKSPYPYFSKRRLSHPVQAAESISRILEKTGQKSSAAGNTSTASATQQTILQSSASATVRPFMKHAQFLVSEYVSIQSSSSPFPGDVRKALASGVFALLDLCGDFGRKAVLAGLVESRRESGGGGAGGAARMVFKEIVGEWEGQAYKG
ncbi:hypothetical protein HDU98_001650 [Podochytrium sp. JEL0797]|nr:hypothetical protein HDU98_001650 [Podochytrium sp. JEL0797]